MVDDMDWKSAVSSEVFRNYVMAELNKEAAEEASRPTPEQVEEQNLAQLDAALTGMDKLETLIQNTPSLLAKFKSAKKALLEHPELIEKVDANFVNGIMMLDLPDEE